MSELIHEHKLKRLQSFEKDASWYRKKYSQLKKKYAGKFIAINNQRIISDTDHDRLLEKLRDNKHKNRTFVIKYISKRNVYPAS